MGLECLASDIICGKNKNGSARIRIVEGANLWRTNRGKFKQYCGHTKSRIKEIPENANFARIDYQKNVFNTSYDVSFE